MNKIVIPPKIIKDINKLKKVRGVLLTGSRVLGKASQNADWDFFILLIDGAPRWRRTWKVGDTWLEVFANDQAQIKKYFKENIKNGRGIDIMMFATGQIVRDDNKQVVARLVKQAKQLWQKGPAVVSQKERRWIDYNVATYIQDLEDIILDDNEAILLINHVVEEMVNYYYRLERLWLPRPKDRLADFKRREPKLYGFIKKIQTVSDWKQNAREAIKLATALGKKFRLKMDGQIYIPPEKK
jgi:hypothetical protein